MECQIKQIDNIKIHGIRYTYIIVICGMAIIACHATMGIPQITNYKSISYGLTWLRPTYIMLLQIIVPPACTQEAAEWKMAFQYKAISLVQKLC